MSLLPGSPTLVTLAALCAVPPAAAAAPKPLGTVTIDAGEHARENTPVTVQLPATLAGQALELRGPGGALAITVAPDGAATFILPRLTAGASARYQLFAARARPRIGVVVAAAADGVAVTIGGKLALRYRADGTPPRPDVKPELVRGGYLHPVLTPSGATVTDDYPADHVHHHGIWTAWTSTKYEGRKPDFWNMGKKSGRKDHVALGTTFSGASAGGFAATLSATDLGAQPPKVVLDERWQVTAYRTHVKAPPYHLFDLAVTESVVGSAPLELPEYRYGGVGVRGPSAWLGKEHTTFLTSEGKDRIAGDGSRPRWLHMSGQAPGRPAGKVIGIAVLDHPDNFRSPQPVRLHPDEPYFSVAPPKAGAFTLTPGQLYRARYRFVVADGAPDPKLLDRLHTDFARPPAVTVELAE